MFSVETPKDGSGPTDFWTELSCASESVILFYRTPACPGTQYSATMCWVEVSFNAFWHCRTSGDVLVVWRAFRAAWLSEQPNVCLNFINTGQDSIYLSLTNFSMFYRQILSLAGPLVHSSLVSIVNLYLHSRLEADYMMSNVGWIRDLTPEAASVCCCVLDWCEGRTNVADSRDHALPLT